MLLATGLGTLGTVEELAQAISRAEGTGSSSSAGARCNNPGDIMYGSFAQRYGATLAPGGFLACFPSMSIGWQALYDLISGSSYIDRTILQAGQVYAPAGHGSNNPAVWAQNVAGYLGVDPATVTFRDVIERGGGTVQPGGGLFLPPQTGAGAGNPLDSLVAEWSVLDPETGKALLVLGAGVLAAILLA